jgi:hypothetical protein
MFCKKDKCLICDPCVKKQIKKKRTGFKTSERECYLCVGKQYDHQKYPTLASKFMIHVSMKINVLYVINIHVIYVIQRFLLGIITVCVTFM